MEEAVTLPISSSITSIVFRNTPSLACLARTERRIWDCETAQRCQTNTRNTGLCITWWPEPSILEYLGHVCSRFGGRGYQTCMCTSRSPIRCSSCGSLLVCHKFSHTISCSFAFSALNSLFCFIRMRMSLQTTPFFRFCSGSGVFASSARKVPA